MNTQTHHHLLRISGLCLSLTTLLASAAPAFAQSSAAVGAPRVLAAPRMPVDTSARDAAESFRAANQGLKRPRMAIFWNRALSDRLQTTREDFVRTRDRALSDETRESDSSAGPAGNATFSQESSSSTREEEVTRGTHVTKDPSRRGLGETNDWPLRSAFQARLLEAGARIVDRNLAMRATHAATGGADDQEVEIGSLLDKADILLEILMTQDEESPTGLSFLVTAKRVKDGVQLASLSTQALRRSNGPPRYVATSNGYRRAPPAPMTLDETGEVLATETLQALARAFGESHD